MRCSDPSVDRGGSDRDGDSLICHGSPLWLAAELANRVTILNPVHYVFRNLDNHASFGLYSENAEIRKSSEKHRSLLSAVRLQ